MNSDFNRPKLRVVCPPGAHQAGPGPAWPKRTNPDRPNAAPTGKWRRGPVIRYPGMDFRVWYRHSATRPVETDQVHDYDPEAGIWTAFRLRRIE